MRDEAIASGAPVVEPTGYSAAVVGPPSHVHLPAAPANYTKIGSGFELIAANLITVTSVQDSLRPPFFPRRPFHHPQPLMDGSIWVVATGSLIFLPDATAPGIKGRVITVKNVTGSLVPIKVRTIATKSQADPQTIDGETSVTLSTAFASAAFMSDGSNWMRMWQPAVTADTTRKPLNVVGATFNITLTVANDLVLVDATGGNITVTLPSATIQPGKQIDIKKIDSSANIVTIATDGSETIDGTSTAVLSSQHDSVTVASDASNWWIL